VTLPRNLTGRIFAVIAATIVVYVVVAAVTGWDSFRDELAAFPKWLILPLVVLSLLNYLLRYVRWEIYLRALGVRLDVRSSLSLFLATFLMVITPGKLGEVFKAGILRERFDVPLAVGLPIILAERIFDFLGVLILAVLGLFAWPGSVAGMKVGFLAAASVPIALAAFRSSWLRRKLLTRATRTPYLQRFRFGLEEALATMTRLLSLRATVLALILSTVAWACECISLWVVCRGLQLEVTVFEADFIYAAGTLIGSLSFLPGGLGGTEATIVWLLMTLDISDSSALSAALVVRVATLWLAVAIGLLAFLAARETFLGGRRGAAAREATAEPSVNGSRPRR